MNGRPSALCIRYTDCRFPNDLDPPIQPSGSTDWGCECMCRRLPSGTHSRHSTIGHAWKFRYSASCLSISLQHIFRTRVPAYSAVLNLDKKIREFPLPPHLQSPIQSSEPRRDWSEDTPRAMQQYCAVCQRESSKRSVILFLFYLTSYRSPIPTQKLLRTGDPRPFCKSTEARIRTFCASNVP